MFGKPSDSEDFKMELIATTVLILLGLVPVYRMFSTGDWEKKWRKIKFETRMSWIGISGTIIDVFYRTVDKVGEKSLIECEVELQPQLFC